MQLTYFFLIFVAFFFLLCVWRLFAKASTVTHAGGVVFRIEKNKKFYLLVTAKRNELRWVIPKGRVEVDEQYEATALREVQEEAGIKGKIQHHIGIANGFKNFITPIKTSFFLMSYTGSTTPTEHRKLCWVSIDEAIQLSSRADQQKIFKMVKQGFTSSEFLAPF